MSMVRRPYWQQRARDAEKKISALTVKIARLEEEVERLTTGKRLRFRWCSWLR